MTEQTATLPLIDETSRFRKAQWRVLLATSICYLFFYTGRQTFGFAIPGIEHKLGIEKDTLGWICAAMLWAYAIGQLVNGNLGDKYGGRLIITVGAILSVALNWMVSFGHNTVTLATPWILNGFAQSMAWAPGSRLLSSWWGQEERGKVYGIYTFSAGMSSAIAFMTSGAILAMDLEWCWIFRLPVLSLLCVGIVFFLLVRNRPEDLGFSTPLVDKEKEKNDETTDSIRHRYHTVFSNRRFLVASLAFGLQNLSRYGLLIWVPVHFLGEHWKHGSSGKWICLALPLGMGIGAFTSGWLSDTFFQTKRAPIIRTFMSLAAIASSCLYFLNSSPTEEILLLFLCGFFVYGSASAFWALCADVFPKGCVGTATGVMGMLAYLLAGFGEPFIGWMIKTHDQNTSLIFPIVSIACLLSALLTPFIKR